MEGLEISEIRLSNLEYSKRLDAEYYRPLFLKYEMLLKGKKYSSLIDVCSFLIGPFGSAFTVENYTENQKYRYIRGKDIKQMRLMDDDNVYMPEADFKRLSKYALRENDILVSVVGTLGNAAIVQKEHLPAIFSCKSTVLRVKNISPTYLLAYINTKYARSLLLRKERGAIQKGLNLDDLKTLSVYLASEKIQHAIQHIFERSLVTEKQAKSTYASAEFLLLDIFGLHNVTSSTQKINIKSFKESFGRTGRLDAEYYQPKYEQIVSHITIRSYAKLADLVTIRKSIEPGSDFYTDEEDGLPFLRVADYSKCGITIPQRKLKNSFVVENYEKICTLKLKKNTILFSKDGSVGQAYCLREDVDFITSGAILHLSIKETTKLLPDYLTLVQMQAERDAGGSIILHWRVGEIEEVYIPLVSMKTQTQIANLVQKSFFLKAESKRLLEVAKRAVEVAIEQNEERAMALLMQESEMRHHEKTVEC